LESPGYYNIYVKVFHSYSAQIALFLNGVVIPGTVSGEPAAASILIINTIIQINDSDLLVDMNSVTGVAAVLQVRNHSSYVSPMLLDGREGSGSDTTQINASICIMQICDKNPSL